MTVQPTKYKTVNNCGYKNKIKNVFALPSLETRKLPKTKPMRNYNVLQKRQTCRQMEISSNTLLVNPEKCKKFPVAFNCFHLKITRDRC